MTDRNNDALVEKIGSLGDVLLEHITDFDNKIEEVMSSFEQTIEALVEQKVNERVEQRLKELGHV